MHVNSTIFPVLWAFIYMNCANVCGWWLGQEFVLISVQ